MSGTNAVEPASILGGLPEPSSLKAQINTWYAGMVEERGKVHTPEDTFSVQRRLAAALEMCQRYKATFEEGRKLVAQLQEEQLIDAVGEVASSVTDQPTGQPMTGLTVPDADGDIRLTLDETTTYEIDTEQLMASVCAVVIGTSQFGGLADHITDVVNGDADGVPPEQLENVLAEAFMEAQHVLLTTGKFEPQVTKVRAYADTLARRGEDGLSGVVRQAIRKKRTYKGVKMSRKEQPK